VNVLRKVHGVGVVHCDISLSNLMQITRSFDSQADQPVDGVIVDWGSARRLDEDGNALFRPYEKPAVTRQTCSLNVATQLDALIDNFIYTAADDLVALVHTFLLAGGHVDRRRGAYMSRSTMMECTARMFSLTIGHKT
jgi:serine/threonine protein kinase